MALTERILSGNKSPLEAQGNPGQPATPVPGGDERATVSLPVWPAEVPVHPAAELFPLMVGAAFEDLVRDIAAHGLTDPIVRMPDGQILDGRNRYRACVQAGVEPTYEVYGGEPWRYVISTNLHRRHLTDGQRATIAAKLAARSKGEYARRANVSAETFAPLPPTRDEAAQLLNVSTAQVKRALQVQKRGTSSLQAAVESGSVPVTTAARVAAQPELEQEAFVQRVISGGDPRKLAAPQHPATPATIAPTVAGGAAATTTTAGGGTRRTYYRRSDVVSRSAIEEIVGMAGGLRLGLADASGVDESVTSAEAARWMDELSEGIRSLRKLRTLLKERTS